jgi:hypothetical protein
MSRSLPAGAILLLLALGACARTPIVSYNLVTPPPRPHELREAVGEQDVPVVVTSSPFAGVTARQLASVVVTAMPSLCSARYYAADTPGARGMVWSFTSAAPDIQADLRLAAPPRGLLSEVQGQISGLRDPADPAFAGFVHQMILALLRACA